MRTLVICSKTNTSSKHMTGCAFSTRCHCRVLHHTPIALTNDRSDATHRGGKSGSARHAKAPTWIGRGGRGGQRRPSSRPARSSCSWQALLHLLAVLLEDGLLALTDLVPLRLQLRQEGRGLLQLRNIFLQGRGARRHLVDLGGIYPAPPPCWPSSPGTRPTRCRRRPSSSRPPPPRHVHLHVSGLGPLARPPGRFGAGRSPPTDSKPRGFANTVTTMARCCNTQPTSSATGPVTSGVYFGCRVSPPTCAP